MENCLNILSDMQEQTDKISCVLLLHIIKKPSYKNLESSIGDRPIHKNATIEALEALGATLNFIDIWLKLLDHNYDVKREVYIAAMKEMF